MTGGADRPGASRPLRDAHMHLYQYARSLEMLDLSSCTSAAELVERVAGACRVRRGRGGRGDGRVLIADKARPEAFDPPGWPVLADLDAATGDDILLCAWCFDYHALMVNTAALRHAGLGPDTPDPPGGVIGRDADGALTGVLYEQAALRLWESLPDPDRGRAGELIERGIDALRALGIVEVHDLKAQPWLGGVLASLADRGVLDGFRVTLWPLLEDLGGVLETRKTWQRDTVRLGGAKIFVDGTLNSRTAWMLDDYADGRPEHPRGMAMMPPGRIEEAVRRCDAAGVPLAAHAIGDAAVRAVLDAIERVRPETPGFRVEHAELIDAADVGRFAGLGVICSVQPCHLLYDIEALRRGVPDRLDRVLPLRSLIDSGCEPGRLLIFGSDAPIVRPDPGDSLRAAVYRCRVDDPEPLNPAEAITHPEALAAFS